MEDRGDVDSSGSSSSGSIREVCNAVLRILLLLVAKDNDDADGAVIAGRKP